MPDFLGTIQGEVEGIFSPRLGQESPYYKTPSLASNVFGINGSSFTKNTPLMGFQYFVKVTYNGELEEYIKSIFGDSGSKALTDTMPLVKNVALPGVGISTDVLNEYNRHRINQQRLDWQPCKITFHDVVGGDTFKLWTSYYQYYFQDGDKLKTLEAQKARTNPELGSFNLPPGANNQGNTGDNFGYNITRVQNQKYLFKTIEVYQVQGQLVNKTTMYNPRISSFDHDVLAYESSNLLEVSMSFDYEWIEYDTGILLSDSTTRNGEELIDPTVTQFFSEDLSVPFNLRQFENFVKNDLPTTVQTPGTVDQTPSPAVGNQQTPLETLRNVKREASGVLGKVASASALFNQIQIDVLGVDEPIIEAPSVRDFSAVITQIPTSYPDIRRVARRIGN